MKVTVNEKKHLNKTKSYPYIGHEPYQNILVLFTGEKIGTALNDSEDFTLGYFCNTWLEERFMLFDGEIVLSND